MPRKSRTRGSAMVISRSMNSYMTSPRSVTLAPIGQAFANLEGRDRLLGAGDHRLLAGDGGQIVQRLLDLLGVRSRLARADIQHDLVDLRHLHRIGVAELLHQFGPHGLVVALLEARHIALLRRALADANLRAGIDFAALVASSWLAWRLLIAAFVPASDIDDLTGLLGKANLASVVQSFESNARGLARLGIDMREVGQMDGGFLVHDTALLLCVWR